MAAYLGYTLRMNKFFVADQLWFTTHIREEDHLIPPNNEVLTSNDIQKLLSIVLNIQFLR